MTYEFHFKAHPLTPIDLGKAEDIIKSSSLVDPVLTENSKMTTIKIQARKAAFRINIKKI